MSAKKRVLNVKLGRSRREADACVAATPTAIQRGEDGLVSVPWSEIVVDMKLLSPVDPIGSTPIQRSGLSQRSSRACVPGVDLLDAIRRLVHRRTGVSVLIARNGKPPRHVT